MTLPLVWTELFPQDNPLVSTPPDRKTFLNLKDETYLRLAFLKFPTKLPEEAYPTIRKLYNDNLMVLWLNEGHKFVVKWAECLTAEATAPIIDTSAYWYWLWNKCSVPQHLYFKDSTGNERELIAKRQAVIDEMYPNWETNNPVSSTPLFVVYLRHQRGDLGISAGSGQSFKLYPKPNLTGTIRLGCLRKAENLVNDGDYVSLEDEHYQAVIEYVIARTTGDKQAILDLRERLQGMKMEDRDRDQIGTIQAGFNGLEEPEDYT